MRVSKAELQDAQEPEVMLDGEGSKYLAGLAVFHELHCLVRGLQRYRAQQLTTSQRRLRQLLYRDHYFPDMTLVEHADALDHAGMEIFSAVQLKLYPT